MRTTPPPHHPTTSPPHNRLFTEEMLALLLRPQAWQLVTSALPPDVEPAEDERHHRWMDENTHVHAHQEILVALEGEGQYGLLGRVYPAPPGTVFLFDRFEEHDSGYPEWSGAVRHLWVSVLPDHFVARLLDVSEGSTRSTSVWSCLVTREEAGLAPGSRLEMRQDAPGLPPAVARLRMTAILSLLIGALVREGYADPQEEERGSFQARIVQSVREHIEHTAGNGASLEHLARIAGYSTFHFLRLFKEHTGFTVHEYIDHCRLRRAREMRERGCTQKEVAVALGFSCPSAFCRWYRGKHSGG